MATEPLQANLNDTDMKDVPTPTTHNNNTSLLPTSSHLIPATPQFPQTTDTMSYPSNNTNNNQKPTATPPQTHTLSIPNTALRNLAISTPLCANTENKEMEVIPNKATQLICDTKAYIARIDNKRLAKLSETNPNKTYNRIQVQNSHKFKSEIQSIMQNIIQRKTKKLLKKSNKNHSKSDKVEMDCDENSEKTKQISNECKLDIINKALQACYAQLIHFNKLFLYPVSGDNSQSNNNNRKALSKETKDMKQKILGYKQAIEQRKCALMQQIERLNKLRMETSEISVEIPKSVSEKIVTNLAYNNAVSMDESGVRDREMREILGIINENKRKKMEGFKSRFEELKANEMRLRERAERVRREEESLKRAIELRKKNMQILASERERNRVSIASTCESTIHGSLSPMISNRNNNESGNGLSFEELMKEDNGEFVVTNDIQL